MRQGLALPSSAGVRGTATPLPYAFICTPYSVLRNLPLRLPVPLPTCPLAAFSRAHFTGAINSSELSVTTMVTVPELPRSACKERVFTAMYGARGLMDW